MDKKKYIEKCLKKIRETDYHYYYNDRKVEQMLKPQGFNCSDESIFKKNLSEADYNLYLKYVVLKRLSDERHKRKKSKH